MAATFHKLLAAFKATSIYNRVLGSLNAGKIAWDIYFGIEKSKKEDELRKQAAIEADKKRQEQTAELMEAIKKHSFLSQVSKLFYRKPESEDTVSEGVQKMPNGDVTGTGTGGANVSNSGEANEEILYTYLL